MMEREKKAMIKHISLLKMNCNDTRALWRMTFVETEKRLKRLIKSQEHMEMRNILN